MEKWRHKRRGSTYTGMGAATLTTSSSRVISEGDRLIVFRDEFGKLWAQPNREFYTQRELPQIQWFEEAEVQASSPMRDGHLAMVYRDETKMKLWLRPHREFHDGRFEKIA